MYWWTQEIAYIQRRCLRLLRIAQRTRDRVEVTITLPELKAERKNYDGRSTADMNAVGKTCVKMSRGTMGSGV